MDSYMCVCVCVSCTVCSGAAGFCHPASVGQRQGRHCKTSKLSSLMIIILVSSVLSCLYDYCLLKKNVILTILYFIFLYKHK